MNAKAVSDFKSHQRKQHADLNAAKVAYDEHCKNAVDARLQSVIDGLNLHLSPAEIGDRLDLVGWSMGVGWGTLVGMGYVST